MNIIIVTISSLCIIAGAIIKLSNINNIHAKVLFIIGFIGFILFLVCFAKSHKHK